MSFCAQESKWTQVEVDPHGMNGVQDYLIGLKKSACAIRFYVCVLCGVCVLLLCVCLVLLGAIIQLSCSTGRCSCFTGRISSLALRLNLVMGRDDSWLFHDSLVVYVPSLHGRHIFHWSNLVEVLVWVACSWNGAMATTAVSSRFWMRAIAA